MTLVTSLMMTFSDTCDTNAMLPFSDACDIFVLTFNDINKPRALNFLKTKTVVNIQRCHLALLPSTRAPSYITCKRKMVKTAF